MPTPNQERRLVSEFSVELFRRGFVANHDGNVSARIGREGRFLITPTGVSKRLCTPESLVECDRAGKPVGRGKPPSELALHLGAYRRDDVRAVIHAHPPYASAFALAQVPLAPVAMPEVVVSLGERIPMVPLFLPREAGVAEAVASALDTADVALLAGNGAIAVGPDLETAYLRLELLEHYARILTIARGAPGAPASLSPDALARLLEMRKQAGLHREARAVDPKTTTSAKGAPGAGTTVRAAVADEVRRALGGKS
jgi:L-fuculose-phosphate aldolase